MDKSEACRSRRAQVERREVQPLNVKKGRIVLTYEDGIAEGLRRAHAIASKEAVVAAAEHATLSPTIFGNPRPMHHTLVGYSRAAKTIATEIYDQFTRASGAQLSR